MFFVFKLPELSRSCSKQIINIFQLSINYIFQLYSEPVARRCSVKKVSLKNSQNAQENTSARASILINLQVSGLQLY